MATATTFLSSQLFITKPIVSLKFNVFPNSRNFNYRRKSLCFPPRCCLNLPLEPRSPAGRSLISVLQNEPQSFYDAVSAELNRVADDRDDAFARYELSLFSPEAPLHRRIAELKEAESQISVQDVLYMIILFRFSEIRVPLVPSLSRCLYNGRLEILPSKDWELESIHSLEFLEMVREHLSTVLGWKAGSSVAVNWSTTKVRKQHLSQVYKASILFGYFLKSASFRLRLEHNLPPTVQSVPFGSRRPPQECKLYGIKKVVLGQVVTPSSTTLSQVSSRPGKQEAKLKCYVTGLDMQTREACAKLESEAALKLIETHCAALFGSDCDELILTSLSSMKRLVMEAVAFGCFLWDAEQCVSTIYKHKD